jgi:hypothetical protein
MVDDPAIAHLERAAVTQQAQLRVGFRRFEQHGTEHRRPEEFAALPSSGSSDSKG